MPDSNNSPSVLRILLGTHLKRLRESRRITLGQAAQVLGWSLSMVNLLESGQVGIKEKDLMALLAICGVTDIEERAKLLDVIEKSNASDWWRSYSDIIPNWLEAYLRLESSATQIQMFEAGQIPDLLQADDYSQVIISHNYRFGATTEVTRRVQLGAARRKRYLDQPGAPHLRAVLSEAALRRQVGSEYVMLDQLRYLMKLARHPNTEIQILPLTDSTVTTETSFRILQFSEPNLRDVVYREQLAGAVYLDKKIEVDAYMRDMHQLIRQALPVEESALLLQRMLSA